MNPRLVEAAQAQLQLWYPQFGPVVPPLGTAAVRAWRGRIQPFPDGAEFASVMAHLEVGETVRIESYGRVAHPHWCKRDHSFFLRFSSAMTATFEIVLLSFEGSRHPRTYCVAPEISRRAFPLHPHLRDDQGAIIDDKPVTALCIYLASDGVLQRDELELAHALDFTSIFLAKHSVWSATNFSTRLRFELRTDNVDQFMTPHPQISRLFEGDRVFDGTASCYASLNRSDANWKNPGEQLDGLLTTGQLETWLAPTWVGPVAPHFQNELLQQLEPESECHCGSGDLYADCHRAQDELATAGISGLRGRKRMTHTMNRVTREAL